MNAPKHHYDPYYWFNYFLMGVISGFIAVRVYIVYFE